MPVRNVSRVLVVICSIIFIKVLNQKKPDKIFNLIIEKKILKYTIVLILTRKFIMVFFYS